MNNFYKSIIIFVLPLLFVIGNVSAAYNPLGLNQAGTLTTSNLPGDPTTPGNIGYDAKVLTETFTESTTYDLSLVPSQWTAVDPSMVYLSQSVRMRIWQVGEVAGMQSQVGLSIGADYTLPVGKEAVVFSDTTTSPNDDPYDFSGTHKVRVRDAGPGKLDFFVIADANNAGTVGNDYNSGSNTGDHYLYWTDLTPTGVIDNTAGGFGKAVVNADAAGNNMVDGTGNHALAFLHSSGDFLMYAWEDLSFLYNDVGWGSVDYDFNDVFFLVKAKDAIVIVPEPETYMLMGGFLLIALFVARRRRAAVKVRS
jgi:hypothetical protein